MKKTLIIIVALILLVICGGMLLETQGGEWKNYGHCSTVIDANGLTKTQTLNSYLVANLPGRIPCDKYWAATKVRWRGADANSCATLEMWGKTGMYGDGEFICDVNLPVQDANAAPATMGGVYFGNITFSNNGLATSIGKQNCDTNYRMGVLVFDRTTFDTIYIKVKVVAGTIYWDACGYL